MAPQVTNGIDLDALKQTMAQIQQNPKRAQFNFQATNRWVNGTHNQARVKDFLEGDQPDTSRTVEMIFEEDEPPSLFGENRGANPVEYVLIGLSGCLTTALVAHAAARGVELKSVRSRLEGDLDVRGFLGMSDEVRNGYEGIRVTFEIESDASEETLQELVEIARQRSPVFDIVTHPVPVSVRLEQK